jgi:hypothetical protein
MVLDESCVGKRIRLLKMGEDPDPIEALSEGVITWFCKFTENKRFCYQLSVDWDNGRSLGLVYPYDKFVII